MILELVAAETERAGKLHASIRHIGVWSNLQKNTAQRCVTRLLEQGLIELSSRGGVWGSASYRITGEGLAALQALQFPQEPVGGTRDSDVDTERRGTWYMGAAVPDAMRSTGLRGAWELWRSLPHGVWFTAEEALPYVTARTTRSVRNWVKALATLEIPLAEWAKAGTRFRLLEADPGVFEQLRLVQEHEAGPQGSTLVSRASLERSYAVERTRADEALDKRRRA